MLFFMLHACGGSAIGQKDGFDRKMGGGRKFGGAAGRKGCEGRACGPAGRGVPIVLPIRARDVRSSRVQARASGRGPRGTSRREGTIEPRLG